jgi:hypothetical protein
VAYRSWNPPDGIEHAPRRNLGVIAGLDPAIHDAPLQAQSVLLCLSRLIMDARVKPAHDVARLVDTSELQSVDAYR